MEYSKIKDLILNGAGHIKLDGGKYALCSLDAQGKYTGVALSSVDKFDVFRIRKEFETMVSVSTINSSEEGLARFKAEQEDLVDKATIAINRIPQI